MIGELIEKLCTATIKLYNVCETKADIAAHPAKYSKEQIVENNRQDIELCRLRSQLKNQIDKIINRTILQQEGSVIEEVKRYGQDS